MARTVFGAAAPVTETMSTSHPEFDMYATPESKGEISPVAGLLSSAGNTIRPARRTWSIGELARHFGVTTRTIRFYEQEGLLHPERRGQTRLYRDKDRVRLKLTLRGKRLGFSLAEIREVVDLYDAADGGGEKQITCLLGVLDEKREGLERQLRDLTAMQRELDDVESRAREALERLKDRNQIERKASD